MTRDQLAADTATTIEALNDTIRAAIMLGKPCETADYATALRETAAAYDALNPPELED